MPDNDIQINRLQAQDHARWDAFVAQCLSATFFHRSAWRNVIDKAFGHPTYFMYAEEQGRITGILPLVHMKSLMFGNSLVSMPFAVYGGIAADTQVAADALQAEAVKLGEDLAVDFVELRNRAQSLTGWTGKDLYVGFSKTLLPDPEDNLKAIPRKQRAMVRKGIKAGLQSRIDDDIDDFFSCYSESVRNLGTPVFPRRYFAILRDEFREDCEILTVTYAGEPICSVMNFYFRDQVLPYYGGGGNLARLYKGNDFMYWQVMCRALQRGVSIFDYGRSKKGTGSYSFKKNWGFEAEDLHYQYKLIKADAVPDINPLNPRYRLFINAWKHLPLGVSRVLGPMISRHLG